ncbi:MAG: Protein serine/threonine phosphatase PrpC,regulation of stationary phase [Clostridiales bacterium 38_11]|nr:MAG: Protein serine/threonine phosphatase PrpC,regulation of stationary phase [Clostridiales bacterium 38_11]HBH12142.1 Stp1/IreP family PP2C-type Ser/Thr phosphatase [Clostridiales bacterium]
MKGIYRTDIGNFREKNEDSVIYLEHGDFILAAVADGMGGHKSGEVASRLALESAERYFHEKMDIMTNSPMEFINNIFLNSCLCVYQEGLTSEEFEGMGTTMTVVLINKANEQAYFGNIGDSRAYVATSDSLRQVTEDHSLVHEMYRNGEISLEEIDTHPQRHVLTKALGTCETVIPDYYQEDLTQIDHILLCTDGLTNCLLGKEILFLINQYKDQAVVELIGEAKRRGGTDNISVVLISN